MSRRTRITIEVDGTIFSMRGWRARELARSAGLRPTFNGVRGAWVADTKRLGDLLAYAESRNIPVVIEDPRQGELFDDVTATHVADDGVRPTDPIAEEGVSTADTPGGGR